MGEKEVIALVFCTFLLVLSLAFIGARLYVRWCMLGNAGKDDLFCVLAGVLSAAETGLMFLEVVHGSGKKMSELSAQQIQQQRFSVYLSMPPYYIGLMFIKISIIFQYQRFASHTITRVSSVILAFVVCTTIIWVCLSAFICRPVRAFWEMVPGKKCLDLATINYSFLAVNATTDIALFVLPLPTFCRLKLRKAQKRALVGIFMLGGFAALTSILRIPSIWYMDHGGDPVYHGFGIIVWTRIEMGVSIICACLPCLRAPLARWFPHIWGSVKGSMGSSKDGKREKLSFRRFSIGRKRQSRSATDGEAFATREEERRMDDSELLVSVPPRGLDSRLDRDKTAADVRVSEDADIMDEEDIMMIANVRHSSSEQWQVSQRQIVDAQNDSPYANVVTHPLKAFTRDPV